MNLVSGYESDESPAPASAASAAAAAAAVTVDTALVAALVATAFAAGAASVPSFDHTSEDEELKKHTFFTASKASLRQPVGGDPDSESSESSESSVSEDPITSAPVVVEAADSESQYEKERIAYEAYAAGLTPAELVAHENEKEYLQAHHERISDDIICGIDSYGPDGCYAHGDPWDIGGAMDILQSSVGYVPMTPEQQTEWDLAWPEKHRLREETEKRRREEDKRSWIERDEVRKREGETGRWVVLVVQ
jgi:hypothetical protein